MNRSFFIGHAIYATGLGRVIFNCIRFTGSYLKTSVYRRFRLEMRTTAAWVGEHANETLRISFITYQYADMVNARAKVQAVAAQLCHRAEFFVITSQA